MKNEYYSLNINYFVDQGYTAWHVGLLHVMTLAIRVIEVLWLVRIFG